MEQPQEVEDEDYERTWERVAAVGVAKATGVVCTRAPDGDRPGQRLTRIWTVQATVAGERDPRRFTEFAHPNSVNADSGGLRLGRVLP